MEHNVTSCSTCPLFNAWEDYCTHPTPANYIDYSETTPKDCPLRTEKLIIYFKE